MDRLQVLSSSRALYRRFCTKTGATPLGKIETRKITAEEYKLLQLHRYRKKNIAVGVLLLAGVLSVYGYSMYAVNQDPLRVEELEQEVESSKSTNN